MLQSKSESEPTGSLISYPEPTPLLLRSIQNLHNRIGFHRFRVYPISVHTPKKYICCFTSVIDISVIILRSFYINFRKGYMQTCIQTSKTLILKLLQIRNWLYCKISSHHSPLYIDGYWSTFFMHSN